MLLPYTFKIIDMQSYFTIRRIITANEEMFNYI